MVRRTSRIVVLLFSTLFAATTIATGVLAWRLTQGPLSVAFVTPYVVPALSDAESGISVVFDDAVIDWDREALALDFAMLNLRLIDKDKREIARFPSVKTALSGAALLRGMIAPTYVEVDALDASIIRKEDGTFELAVIVPQGNAPTSAAEQTDKQQPDFLALILGAPDKSTPLGYLNQVIVTDAKINFEDRVIGSKWNTLADRVEVRRGPDGLRAVVVGELTGLSEDRRTRVEFNADYAHDFDLLTGTLQVQNILLGDLAERLPPIALLKGTEIPINASFDIRHLVKAGRGTLGFAVAVGEGALVLDELLPEPLFIRNGRVLGEADITSQNIIIEALEISTEGDFVLRAGGRVQGRAGAVDLFIKGGFDKLQVGTLKKIWPIGAASGARDWVVNNMVSGEVFDVDFTFDIPAEVIKGEGELEQDDIALRFNLRNGKAHYLRPMPPLTAVRAQGQLTAKTFTATVDHAEVAGAFLSDGSFRIPQLDDVSVPAEIQVVLTGPLPNVMSIVDSEPLGFMSRIGLVPSTFSGESASRVKLSLPLTKGVKMEDLHFAVASNLRDVDLPPLVDGLDMKDANLTMQVIPDGMRAEGTLSINGVPVEASWQEDFQAERPNNSSLMQGRAVLSTEQRAALGADLYPYIDGPVAMAMQITGRGGDIDVIHIKADASKATVSVPELGWGKPVGEEVQLDIKFTPEPGKFVFHDIIATGLTLNARGRFQLLEGRFPRNIEVDYLKWADHTDISATLKTDASGVLLGTLRGTKFDLTRFLGEADAAVPPDRDKLTDPNQKGLFEGETIKLAVQLDQVGTRSGVGLNSVTGHVEIHDDLITDGAIEASFAPEKMFRAKIAMQPDARREVRIQADDAGRALQGVGLIETAEGGRMTIGLLVSGELQDMQYEGGAHAKDMRIKKLPALANLLNIGSLTGIGDLLQGEGLLFSTIDVPVKPVPQGLRIEKAKAVGPSLGVHASGLVEPNGGMDIGGTIAPAYSINSALGQVPVIGELLVGGKGQGIFAANFTMKGEPGDLKMTVNPLSALTPGFLRGIFGKQGTAGEGDADVNRVPQSGPPKTSPSKQSAPQQPAMPSSPPPSNDPSQLGESMPSMPSPITPSRP